MAADLSALLAKLAVKFTDQKLLQQVFIHRSYLNENHQAGLEHNERLEFLGDAVLELVVTEYLYLNYPNPEGELTNWRSALVRGAMISEVANQLDFGDYLLLSKGENRSGGKSRQIILANTFEAFIGALYLDQGYQAAADFIHRQLTHRLPAILADKSYLDAKSRLQELAQEQHSQTPNYRVLAELGPDHNKNFTVGVYLGPRLMGEGTGSSKQSAEQAAARQALLEHFSHSA